MKKTFSLLLSLTLAGPLWAQHLPTRVIRLDVNKAQGPLSHMPDFCVGAGRANEGLRADWQQQLRLVQQECGFRYLRFHGLLHDDMGVYQEDKQGRPVYNWQYVDKLYDYLLRVHVKPFVELSFMPAALRSNDKTVFWWKGNVSPPKDDAKWAAFVTALVRHWEERYGRAEVASWYFEVWNEPNLADFFTGTQADYYQLYATTARAIKAVSPSYRVGGPATAGTAWIPETIRYCAQNQVPLDFVSTHDYGVGEGALDEFGQGQQKLGLPNSVAQNVQRVRTQLPAAGTPSELHFTEWSTSYSARDPVHDDVYSAPFILHTLKRAGTAATSMSYWTFTDIFEEGGPGPAPFHGGFGLLTLQGIRKPSFFAYKYLHELGPTELRNPDPASWATRDAAGNVQVLLWNLTPPAQGDTTNQVYFRRLHPAAPAEGVQLALQGLAPGRYRVETYRVGYDQNDAYSAYLRLGRPSYLTPAQVAALHGLTQDKPTGSQTIRVGATGTQQPLVLRANDVALVKFIRLGAGPAQGAARPAQR